MDDTTIWTVKFTGKARKQRKDLPSNIVLSLKLLRDDLEKYGPVVSKWPNFGKLVGKTDFYHCHLNKGRPRYVAVWKEVKQEIRLVEIRYVGTHENADYRRIN